MSELDILCDKIIDIGLKYPESYIDHPWGESVCKVGKKVFLFVGGPVNEVTVTVKLPENNLAAATLPFAKPSGYGLGKSGWITAAFSTDAEVDFELISDWVDESYRAIAPKKLVKLLDDLKCPDI